MAMQSRNKLTKTVVNELRERANELAFYNEAATADILKMTAILLEDADRDVNEMEYSKSIKVWKEIMDEAIDYLTA